MKRGCLAVGVLIFVLPGLLIFLLFTGAAGQATATNCTVAATQADLPSSVGQWSGESITVAAAIIDKGSALNVPERGILIALMTAMQESKLQNLDHGDRDSIGPFQQRPSAGWGTVDQIMDLNYSTAAFYGGPTGPNQGTPQGLLDIPDWESKGMGAVAQAVQVSAYPDAYAKWEDEARELLTALGGGSAHVEAMAPARS